MTMPRASLGIFLFFRRFLVISKPVSTETGNKGHRRPVLVPAESIVLRDDQAIRVPKKKTPQSTGRLSWCRRNVFGRCHLQMSSLLLAQCFNTRQCLAFEEFERSAAARRDVRDLVFKAGLFDCGD